jgi:hypothetical protein
MAAKRTSTGKGNAHKPTAKASKATPTAKTGAHMPSPVKPLNVDPATVPPVDVVVRWGLYHLSKIVDALVKHTK